MNLTTLLTYIGIGAVIFTLLVVFFWKREKSLVITFLQSFCGLLFLFSGWVKAVDPLGTAYKMEQYFHEFEYTFEPSIFSFLTPLFPFLGKMSIGISVAMIVFEIVLGMMLLIGYKPKFTAWAFLLLVIFFTKLTGFTYLTGYVPSGGNFFDFSSWGEYTKSNMKVTDCGCFGDFLKLEPKVSFFKDVFLLIPAIIFVFSYRKFHDLFSSGSRTILVGLTLIGTFILCLSNYAWDLPSKDFRPFKNGVDIKEQKLKEQAAMSLFGKRPYTVTNKATGESFEMSYTDYTQKWKDYPKEEYDFTREEVTVSNDPQTKISEFFVYGEDEEEITDQILSNPDYTLMIVSYKLEGKGSRATKIVKDTIYQQDSIPTSDKDKFIIVNKPVRVEDKEVQYTAYVWDKDFMGKYQEKIKPLIQTAKQKGIESYIITGGADSEMANQFKNELGINIPIYSADDLLLKTIVRSNPGVVLMKNGKIIHKWHINKLPAFDEMAKKYMEVK